MKNAKGFTLLEVVVALTLFAIVLSGLAVLFPVGFQSSNRATILTRATIYAQRELENIKMDGYGTLTEGGPTAWTDFLDTTGKSTDIQWRRTVTQIGPGGNGLRQVDMEVRWRERGVWIPNNRIERFTVYVGE